MKPTVAALSFLALVTAMLAWFVPSSQVPAPMWIFSYLVLSAMGVFSWRHAQAPTKAKAWLLLALAVAVLGAILAGVESLVFGPTSTIVQLDILAAVTGVALSLSGAVYTATK